MIVLRSTGIRRLFHAAGFGVAAWGAWLLANSWGNLSLPLAVAIAAVTVGAGLSALDGLQRQWEFHPHDVRQRRLFVWRQWSLPDEVAIGTDRRGRMVLRDAAQETILAVPARFNRHGELEKRFWHLRSLELAAREADTVSAPADPQTPRPVPSPAPIRESALAGTSSRGPGPADR